MSVSSGSAMKDSVSPQEIEFLTNASQILWRETSLENMIRRFTEMLHQDFGVESCGFFALTLKAGKLTWTQAANDAKGVAALDEVLVAKLEKALLALPLKSQEYRQGINTFAVGRDEVNFVLMGDPAADWNILVWQMPTPNAAVMHRRSGSDEIRATQVHTAATLEFLVRQIQSGCVWFNRLDKTQALLYRDDLTGLFNSRYLDLALESEVRRAQRFQTGFCLLFIDLDNFKPVNDQYGHLAGSSVLKQVAGVLREALREVDSIIRYGGDEYIVLLLGANPATGLLAAERIRRRIEKTQFRVEGGVQVSITASIGVAAFPEHGKDKETLLRLADESMYEGKRGGKNRVVIVGAPNNVEVLDPKLKRASSRV